MPSFTLLAAPALLLAAPLPANTPNPQIDYPAFEVLVRNIGPIRETHRLAWPEFSKAAQAGESILLDTRSASAFARGHLKGAINLPFSDFTDDKLREVLGDDRSRPIYIYCNNNFRANRPPIALKRVALALNIPTFINLHGYGYRNVWELASVVATSDPGVEWVTNGSPP